jgi:secreted Zn-dependent insulinase-like peptidase
MFIEKIKNINVNLDQVVQDLNWVLTQTDWLPENQIGLVHRLGSQDNLWKDCVGSLYDKERKIETISENEFTEFNADVPIYTKKILNQLAEQENFKLGRVRYMLLESKKGLTVHYDTSERYHLVIETNPYAYVAHTAKTNSVKALCYHLPKDGWFYRVNTRQEHFVYNGGTEPRIHLVICPR